MCEYCYYNRWAECTKDMSEEEYEKAVEEDNCPYFLVYWAKEKDPYVEH